MGGQAYFCYRRFERGIDLRGDLLAGVVHPQHHLGYLATYPASLVNLGLSVYLLRLVVRTVNSRTVPAVEPAQVAV